MNGGGTSSAAFNASGAAAILQFGGGAWNLNAGTTFAGPGTVSIFTADTVSVNAAVSTPAATTLSFTAGTLQGRGTLTLAGPFLWTAGLMTGTGTTQVNGSFTCASIGGPTAAGFSTRPAPPPEPATAPASALAADQQPNLDAPTDGVINSAARRQLNNTGTDLRSRMGP